MILFSLLFASIKVFPSHFEVNGKPTLIRAGSLQWYRLPKTELEDRVFKFKAMGYNTVEMYTSWQYIEPLKRKFDTEHLNTLKYFLELLKQYRLYAYFRPGPFICNEENSGGFPPWIIADSVKYLNATHLDGKYCLRTEDVDYMQAVESYFGAVNAIASQYQITTDPTNPIILYQLENEFNYFEQSTEIDKYVMYNGTSERTRSFKMDAYKMFSELKMIAKSQGIIVPFTTCPGSVDIPGMHHVEDILPLPNYYGSYKTIEQAGYNYKHYQSQLPLYQHYPSGISETYRSASMLSRFVISGMDLVSNFNAFGFYSSGHHNSIVPVFPGVLGVNDLPRLFTQIFQFKNPGDIISGFVKPPVGLMPNVLDYDGPVSPSGLLRDKFFHFRRLNSFYDSFEHVIAMANLPSNTKNSKLIKIKYTRDTVYFLELPNGSILLGLLNEGHASQEIPKNSISFQNTTFPQFPFTLPTEGCNTMEHPDATITGNPEKYYLMQIVINWPLRDHLKINYSTAEILSFKSTNTNGIVHTLFVYNQKRSKYELDFQMPKIDSMSCGIANCQSTSNGLYIHGSIYNEPSLLSIEYTNNNIQEELRIIVLDRYLSSRVWDINSNYLIGVDLYNPKTNLISFIGNQTNYYTLTTTLQSHSIDSKVSKRISINLSNPKVVIDTRVQSNTTKWIPLQSDLPSLESLEMTEGTIYYRTTVNTTIDRLQINSISDFVTLYLDSKCILSLCPLGTKLDNRDINHNYQFNFPKSHTTELLIKVDIWGRGHIIFPKGHIGYIPSPFGLIPSGIHLRIPAAAMDTRKGIIGKVKVNGKEIKQWEIFHALPLTSIELDNAKDRKLPFPIKNGQVVWISFTVDPISHATPLSLKLHGIGLKGVLYINDKVIGKWISGDSILKKGNFYTATRETFSLLDKDHYPIPKALCTSGFNLVLELDGREEGAILNSISISDSEELIARNGTVYSQHVRTMAVDRP